MTFQPFPGSASVGSTRYLNDSGRSGMFVFRTGDYSAQVTADTLRGIYIPPDASSGLSVTGTDGAWVRQFSGASSAEWFGAVANNSAVDCLAAIRAALQVHGNVELEAGDYYTSAVLIHDKASTRLAGKGHLYNGTTGQGTRLIVSGGTATCVQVGPTAQPATINDFPQGIVLEHVQCSRTAVPVKGGTAAGVRVQYVLKARMERVRGTESNYGLHFFGVVDMRVDFCEGFRSTAGSGAAADQSRCIFVDGTPNIGAAGGNASLYLNNCSATNAAVIADSAGFFINSKFTDCFITLPETVGGSYGIDVVGLGATNTVDANTDLKIISGTFDQATVAPIRVNDVNKSGSVEFVNPYCGPSPGATTGIYVDNCLGTVAIYGGQLSMSSATTAQGVMVVNSNGTTIHGTIIRECTTNGIQVSGSKNQLLVPFVQNNAVVMTGAAVQASGTVTDSIIAPRVKGDAGFVSLGVQVIGAACARLKIDASGIEPAVIGTGSVYLNALPITVRGDYTGAGAVSSAGTINVTGQILTNPTTLYGITTTDSSLNLPAGQVVSFNSDVGISRSGAGVMLLGNGTPGNSSGTLLTTQFNMAGSANFTATGAGAVQLGTGTTAGTAGSLTLTGLTATGAISAATTLSCNGNATLGDAVGDAHVVNGTLAGTNAITSSHATGGIGYATGAGGAVTQITSRTTGVTLDKVCGAITLVSAAGTATWQSFTVTNSTVAGTDVIRVAQKSGTDLNMIHVTAVAAGSFQISFATTGGTTTETPVFSFAIEKAVAA